MKTKTRKPRFAFSIYNEYFEIETVAGESHIESYDFKTYEKAVSEAKIKCKQLFKRFKNINDFAVQFMFEDIQNGGYSLSNQLIGSDIIVLR